MGYMTYFELEVRGEPSDVAQLTANAQKYSDENVFWEVNLMFMRDQASWKWYSWEEDMIEFSSNYPNILFLLSGDGEDRGDVWFARIKDGECVVKRPTLTVPEDAWPESLR